MRKPAIRITAVPRLEKANSGLQAMHFAERYGDEVWALPIPGKYIGKNPDVRFFAFDNPAGERIFTPRGVRVLYFASLFFAALRRRRRLYFVHSFVFAIPLWLLGCKYSIIVHGSDSRFLASRWAQAVGRRALAVFGVGFGKQLSSFKVIELPNIFVPAEMETAPIAHDLLFVLRNAPVKNPYYPLSLARELDSSLGADVAVAGVGIDELPPPERDALTQLHADGRRVEYLGRQSYEEVVALMRSSRTLMVPSLSEGIPKVILEAMCQGMHVIVNSALSLPPAISAMVEKVDLDDWKAIAATVERQRECGRSAINRQFALEYLDQSQSALLSHYDEVYRRFSEQETVGAPR